MSSDAVCRCCVSCVCVFFGYVYIFGSDKALSSPFVLLLFIKHEYILVSTCLFIFFVVSETSVTIGHSSFTVGLYMGRHK